MLVVDFGNTSLRIAVYYKEKLYVIKSLVKQASFPQIVAVRDDLIIGNDAEMYLIDFCDEYYKDFKWNLLMNGNNKEADKYEKFVEQILRYYKTKGELYVKQSLNGSIKIDQVNLTISVLESSMQDKWTNILKKCAENAGFKHVKISFQELNAIKYYSSNFIDKPDFDSNFYCVFNLGCLFFHQTVWRSENGKLTRLNSPEKTDGGLNVFSKLQNLFDNKLKETFMTKILKEILKPETSVRYTKECLNSDLFKSKKYLAECYKKYFYVFDMFCGTLTSIRFTFRHVIKEQEISIEITREEIYEYLKEIYENIKKLIDGSKKILKNKTFKLILLGHGSRIPGVKELFEKEFKENYPLNGVFMDEQVLKGILYF